MPLRALALFLLVLVAGAASAAGQAPPVTAPPASAEAPPAAAGATENFLADVEPLISSQEREAYLALTRPYQRRAFERRFWELRDPYPRRRATSSRSAFASACASPVSATLRRTTSASA